MKTTFSLLLVLVFAVYSLAQTHPNHDPCATGVVEGGMAFMKQIKQELNTENAQVYASVFDKGATWEGPLGQNAIGSDNIKRAAYLLFRTVGPLQCVLWVQRRVSADTWIVDMYQKTSNAHDRSSKDIPTAAGSIPTPYGGDIRTTLVLKKTNTDWTVIAARIADLRLSNTKDLLSISR